MTKLIGIILILFSVSSVFAGDKSQVLKIAIVHSYNFEFVWTSQVEKGFLDRVGKEYKYEVVYRGFLNAKQKPTEVVNLSKDILSDLKKVSFDVLFVSDDNAFELIGKQYFNTNVKVIFAGVNSTLKEYGNNEQEINQSMPSNVYGVLERYEVLPLIKLIQDVVPSSNNMIFMSDMSVTADGVFENIKKEIGDKNKVGLMKIKKIVRSNDFSVWKKVIKSAKTGDVLVIFPFSNVKRPAYLKLDKLDSFADWITQNSAVPEFATINITVTHSFFSTVGINPIEHGEDAAFSFINSRLHVGGFEKRIMTKNYARLMFNPERAKKLGLVIPFELFAYSHSLTRGDIK